MWCNRYKEGGVSMKEDKLGDLSMELSVEVLQLTKELRGKHENVISNQIGRSATSICANIAESKYAHSRADFIAKLEISLKEANETEYWLSLLKDTNYIEMNQYESIDKDCKELVALLVSIVKSMKNTLNK